MNNINIAIFGNPIAHSKSPDIYNYCFKKFNLSKLGTNYSDNNTINNNNNNSNNNYYYTRIFAKNINEIDYLNKEFNLKGANITAPFKCFISKYCDKLSEDAKNIDAVNTIINHKEYKNILGFNTDINGIIDSLNYYKIDLNNKKIAVIGAGGAAIAVIYALQKILKKYDITIFNKTIDNINNLISKFNYNINYNVMPFLKDNILYNYDFIFITIPNAHQYLNNINFNKNSIIFFADYKNIEFINFVKSQVDTVITGEYWLINQAILAFEIFTDIKLCDNKKNKIIKELFNIVNIENINRKKTIDNIFLSGFSGSGKTTFAYNLSKKLNIEYVDLDKLIEEYFNSSINNIFAKFGEENFRLAETEILEKIVKNKNKKIIALGGGSLEKTINKLIIKENGYNVYLYSDLDIIKERIDDTNRPLLRINNENQLLTFFNKRKQNYFNNSDIIFYNDGINNINSNINNVYLEIKDILNV